MSRYLKILLSVLFLLTVFPHDAEARRGLAISASATCADYNSPENNFSYCLPSNGANAWQLMKYSSGAWSVAITASGGAPTTADYLVGTAQAGLSAEIVVGTSPGGELGGTWASPTVDVTHSGSSHASVQAAAEATAAAALASHTGNPTGAHAASAITFTPNGSIAATTVQAAIQEVRDEAGAGTGDIEGVTVTSPLTGGGTSGTVNIACQTASGSQAGCLSSTDWTTFNNKGSGTLTGTITLGTIPKGGTSPALVDSILTESGANVTAAGSLTAGGFNSLTMAPSTTGNPVTFTATGSDAQVPIQIIAKGLTGRAGLVAIGQSTDDSINGNASALAIMTESTPGFSGRHDISHVFAGDSFPGHIIYPSRGTLAAPTATADTDQLYNWVLYAYPFNTVSAGINIYQDGATTGSGAPARFEFITNDVARLGISGAGVINISNLTASRCVETDASKNLVSAAATCSGGSGTVTSVGLVGTANQLTVTGSSPITTSGSWTVSIPASAELSVAKLTNLTSNGFVKTSGGDGTLSVDTASYQTVLTNSAGLLAALSDETGTGLAVFSTTPTFTTNITAPLVIGGTGTTSTLTLKTTTGIGTTNADMIFQVGNNGATEAMRILNSGVVQIGSSLGISGTDSTKLLYIGQNTSATRGLRFENAGVTLDLVASTSGSGFIGTFNNTPFGIFVNNGNSALAISTARNVSIQGDKLLGWTNSATNAQSTIDTAWYRNTAGIIEANIGTAGQWASLLVGKRDAGTTTVTDGLTIGRQSTGTPAAGLGSALLFNINSSTTADQNAAQISALWTTATHASRTADVVIKTVNNAAALAEAVRVTGGGQLLVVGLKTTGAATGKTVVCVDTATGQLYASTSSVTCAN